jgi:hypothetical protein
MKKRQTEVSTESKVTVLAFIQQPFKPTTSQELSMRYVSNKMNFYVWHAGKGQGVQEG